MGYYKKIKKQLSAVLAVLIVLISGCSTFRLREQTPPPNIADAAVTILKVEDARGKGANYLGVDLVGYVIVPIFWFQYKSSEPLSEVTANLLVDKMIAGGIPASYQQHLTLDSIGNFPKDHLFVETTIRKFSLDYTLLHLIIAFGPGSTIKSEVSLDMKVYSAPAGDLVWEGTLSGKDRAPYDYSVMQSKVSAGSSWQDVAHYYPQKVVGKIFDSMVSKFIYEAGLQDISGQPLKMHHRRQSGGSAPTI
ncbi:MAG: hypothetical protein KKH94_00710 [Candidatus Omnitrophica bacterium]|nr:hypothetical protein [Candidatus Omnitrophota bacterium]